MSERLRIISYGDPASGRTEFWLGDGRPASALESLGITEAEAINWRAQASMAILDDLKRVVRETNRPTQ